MEHKARISMQKFGKFFWRILQHGKENPKFPVGPVCANQIHPNYSVGSDQDEAESSMMAEVNKNGPILKNVKRCQPVKNVCAVTKFRQLRHFI